MIEIAICDDDGFAVEKVTKECEKFFDRRNVEYNITQELSGENLLKELAADKIDLLFIDIDMPNINGFQVVAQLQLVKKVETVVFITNQHHLVFDSFTYHPFGFIRKEMLGSELAGVLKRYWEQYVEAQKQCSVKVDGVERKIKISDIIYIESRKHELLINTISGGLKLRSSFQAFEELLESTQFIRIHQGYLVNARFIDLIGKCECQLKTNEIIPMSRHRREQVKRQFAQYLRERE